jgi:hypothetical protein
MRCNFERMSVSPVSIFAAIFVMRLCKTAHQQALQ